MDKPLEANWNFSALAADLKVVKNKYVNAWNNANWQMRAAVEIPDGSEFYHTAALCFRAFAFAGYLDYVGGLIISNWDGRLANEDKFSLICSNLNLRFEKGARPYQTWKKVLQIRDPECHPKTSITPVSAADLLVGIIPSSDLENSAKNPEFAVRAWHDLWEMMKLIHEALPEPKDDLICFGKIISG